jgi:hypothetical protein
MTLDSLTGLAGVVIPLASVVASAVNHFIRDTQAKGEAVPEWLLKAAGILNVLALNGDKALQLVKLVKIAKAPKTEVQP